ncbi:hypothetical protein MKX01_023388, partial [Papaver californicum]
DLGKTLEGSNKWPNSPSNFYSVVGENILWGLALALDGCPEEFEAEIAGDPFWVMRFIGNPGISDSKGLELPENAIGCLLLILHTSHTQCFCAGLLALVNQDDEIPALQVPIVLKQIMVLMKCVSNVRNQAGEWIWSVPILGTFVCNIGDMLKIWSNDLYESTLQRVINNSPNYRVSVAFFYEPKFDDVIEPLEF